MPGQGNEFSVTEILKLTGLAPDYLGVDPETLRVASLRGQALNAAIDLYEEGTLDEDSLHPTIQPAFNAYLQFKKDSGYRPIIHQPELRHPQWGYVGHPDGVAWMRSSRAIVDWKWVAQFDQSYVSLQVRAGYRLAWNAMYPGEQIAAEECYGVQFFTDDAKYRLHPLKLAEADQIFMAALVVLRERIRSGKASRDDLYRTAA